MRHGRHDCLQAQPEGTAGPVPRDRYRNRLEIIGIGFFPRTRRSADRRPRTPDRARSSRHRRTFLAGTGKE
ncbi:hypothetical protein GCM10022206_13670 [Streptomyces chiangmaiensis]